MLLALPDISYVQLRLDVSGEELSFIGLSSGAVANNEHQGALASEPILPETQFNSN